MGKSKDILKYLTKTENMQQGVMTILKRQCKRKKRKKSDLFEKINPRKKRQKSYLQKSVHAKIHHLKVS